MVKSAQIYKNLVKAVQNWTKFNQIGPNSVKKQPKLDQIFGGAEEKEEQYNPFLRFGLG